MATTIRYRQGIDARSGKPLTGAAHLDQSLRRIWTTRTNTMLMLLDFGADLRPYLAEDVTPTLALQIYNELILSAYRWEPEVRVDQLQLVRLTQDGSLGLKPGGLYYPEGRLGNYDIALPWSGRPDRFGLYQRAAA